MPNNESIAKIIGDAVASALGLAFDKNKRDLSPDNDFETVSKINSFQFYFDRLILKHSSLYQPYRSGFQYQHWQFLIEKII